MATHDRTDELVGALEAAARAFADGEATLTATYVLVDEAGELRNETCRALAELSEPPEILPAGNGELYWSRSFAALLEQALQSGAMFILHLNTDVLLEHSLDVLAGPLLSHSRMGAIAGSLDGPTQLTGYRRPRPWFPFFINVAPGSNAFLLLGSCLLIRASALTDRRVSISDLALYRHGFADINLSLQLKNAGFTLGQRRSWWAM